MGWTNQNVPRIALNKPRKNEFSFSYLEIETASYHPVDVLEFREYVVKTDPSGLFHK